MTHGVPEAERKYSANRGATLPDPAQLGAPGEGRHFTLRAEYFDTPDLDLTRAGWSLRRRTGGDDAGWHLKAPRAGDVREETGLPLTDGDVPRELRERVADVVEGRPLLPVATLLTERDQWEVLAADGRPRAQLVFDEVSVGGESWREVEVELVPGEPTSTLDELEAALAASCFVPAEHGSKIAKALQARLTAGRPERDPGTPAGEVVLDYAAKQVGTLQALESGVLADRPDAVHKSRVAARRLRGLFRTFGPLLDAEYTGRLTRELRWFGQVAGEPRDAEVLKEHLLEALAQVEEEGATTTEDDEPVQHRLVDELDARHAAAHAALADEMGGRRYADMRALAASLLADRPLRDVASEPGEDVFGDLVAEAVARVRRRYAKAARRPDDLPRWHEVRKAAKAVRYCCEALVPAYGDDADEAAERWEAVTEALGDVQDTVVAHETLGHLGAEASALGEPVEVYAVLQARQLDKRAASLAAGRKAVEEALAADLSWLG